MRPVALSLQDANLLVKIDRRKAGRQAKRRLEHLPQAARCPGRVNHFAVSLTASCRPAPAISRSAFRARRKSLFCSPTAVSNCGFGNCARILSAKVGDLACAAPRNRQSRRPPRASDTACRPACWPRLPVFSVPSSSIFWMKALLLMSPSSPKAARATCSSRRSDDQLFGRLDLADLVAEIGLVPLDGRARPEARPAARPSCASGSAQPA